jgi:purine nucleosidase
MVSPSSLPLRSVILDTDPGGDDIVALFWLMALKQRGLIQIAAVTTVGGNVSAAQTFRNASQMLSLLGDTQTPLGRGLGEISGEDASHIHGADGMGHLSQQLPPPIHSWNTAIASPRLIIQILEQHPQQVTIVAIGPLTNLAQAEQMKPGVLRQAKDVVIMGGAFEQGGNITSHAEFNIYFDPIAAQTVFASRSDLVVLPLDVTHRLLLSQTQGRSLTAAYPHYEPARVLQQLWDFLTTTALQYRETQGELGFLVHDAAAIAYLCYPHLFTFQRRQVQIETRGEWSRGQTVWDHRLLPQQPNAWVACDVDVAQFFTCLWADFHASFAQAAPPVPPSDPYRP